MDFAIGIWQDVASINEYLRITLPFRTIIVGLLASDLVVTLVDALASLLRIHSSYRWYTFRSFYDRNVLQQRAYPRHRHLLRLYRCTRSISHLAVLIFVSPPPHINHKHLTLNTPSHRQHTLTLL
jgi:hypothetical protein